METVGQIKEQFEAFLKENEKFDRKTIGNLSILITVQVYLCENWEQDLWADIGILLF